MADRPSVKEADWIKVGNVDALVMFVGPEYISVGYYQNRAKAIKEEVIWSGEQWAFKHSDPSGSYLHGKEEAIVKKGPPPWPR